MVQVISKAQLAKAVLRQPEMNKYEAEHAWLLEAMRRNGEIQWYRFNPLRLILGADCTYQPDFMVLLADGTVEFQNVKGGFFRDDAKVKLRVAAQEFPMFRFRLFQKTRQGWQVKEL